MTAKRYIETNNIAKELLKLMAFFALQLPKGINYEFWKELHIIVGDWE